MHFQKKICNYTLYTYTHNILDTDVYWPVCIYIKFCLQDSMSQNTYNLHVIFFKFTSTDLLFMKQKEMCIYGSQIKKKFLKVLFVTINVKLPKNTPKSVSFEVQ